MRTEMVAVCLSLEREHPVGFGTMQFLGLAAAEGVMLSALGIKWGKVQNTLSWCDHCTGDN